MRFENRISEIDALNNEIVLFRPLSEPLLKQIKQYFKIGITYSSNALEGNTLTETETKVVLEDGLTVAGKPLREHYEATGHGEAFDFVFSLTTQDGFSEQDICSVHRLFYRRIDDATAGVYRNVPVVISGTEYIPPPASRVGALMAQSAAEMAEQRLALHPLVFAARVHEAIVNIHPFVDGNGRTARLLMNLALIQAGYAPTIIPPIMRPYYLSAVKHAQNNPHDDAVFVSFISCMVYESTKDYLRILKAAQ
jgi:Fic family protein